MALSDVAVLQSGKSIAFGGAVGGTAKALRYGFGARARTLCSQMAGSDKSIALL